MANSILDSQYNSPNALLTSHGFPVNTSGNALLLSHSPAGVYPNPGTDGVLLFDDTFETGNLSRTVTTAGGTASWGATTNCAVSNLQDNGGDYSARFTFTGPKSPPDSDPYTISELRFDLGAQYPEVWIRFDLLLPANYAHVGRSGFTTNNKFFMLWGTSYSDAEQMGAQTWPAEGAETGISRLVPSYLKVGDGGVASHPPVYADIFTAADLGVWRTYTIRVVGPTGATAPGFGVLQIWKGATLVIDTTTDTYTPALPHTFRYGYLLGAANAGVEEMTYLHIDNLKIGTTEASIA